MGGGKGEIFYSSFSVSPPSSPLLFLGCHNGGGGGNFLKVKRLVLKCIGTQKRLFSEILAARVGCLKRHNFLPRHIRPDRNKELATRN